MRSILIGLLIVLSQGTVFSQSLKEGSPDLPGDLIVNIGFNFLQDEASDMELGFFGSKSVGLYYTNRMEISPKFSFYPAIGLGLEKYSFNNDVNLSRNSNDELILSDISGLGDIKRNKLAITYLEAPLEFRFYPKGTTDGSGLFIAFGGSIGLRLVSHGKVRFENEDGDIFVNKNRESFDLSSLRYGVIGRVGTRGINLFYRVYFSELFDDGRAPDASAPTSFTVGIGINAF